MSVIERVGLAMANWDSKQLDLPLLSSVEEFRFDSDRSYYEGMASAAIEAMPIEKMIIDAYIRGVEWNEENPLDREYRFKAACDYADKTIFAARSRKGGAT